MSLLPVGALPPDIALRPQREDDEGFLRELFDALRAGEPGSALVPPPVWRAMLDQQFALQMANYRSGSPGTELWIIEHAGRPAGRLYLRDDGEAIRVMDIVLAPALRGRGIGGTLLRGVLDGARTRRLPVSLQVEVLNPARRLYQRLEFRDVISDGVFVSMRWDPSPDVAPSGMRYRVPVRLDLSGAGGVRWQLADGARFTEPFFEDTVRRLRQLAGPSTDTVTPLDDWSGTPPAVPPLAIVFHISRCGSTLLARLLASLPRNLVLSEAPIVNDILRVRRDDPAVAPAAREGWLRHAVAAYVASQTAAPARVVIKLDCWHIFEIARIKRAFPGASLLFVHRDPLEVLASLMERPSMTLAPGTVLPGEAGMSQAEYDALSREDRAAAILGAFFRQAAHHRADLVPVPYASLPAFVWTSFPGFDPTPDEVAGLKNTARADAKEPSALFTPDGARKRATASPALRAACARWAAPAYEAWRYT